MLRMLQIAMMAVGALMIFFVFFATRDILLRTESFAYMFFCIVLVAAVPVVGFLLYLLIRPSRTLSERRTEALLLYLTKDRVVANQASKHESQDASKQSKKKRDASAKEKQAK